MIDAGIISLATTRWLAINAPFIEINGPIKPNYTYPVSSGFIGNVIEPDVYISGAITSGTAKNMNTFTNLPIGVWLLYYHQRFTVPTTNCNLTSAIQLRMGTTSIGFTIGQFFAASPSTTLNLGTTQSYLFTQIYTNTDATTAVSFSVIAAFSGTLSASLGSITTVKAIRLA
jgi:hypothetical protein